MNWVGGIRSRIRQQAEKKKQREFFERKRLQAKEKRVVQPKSPEDRSIKTISKDLLHLQAVSRAYDGAIDDDEAALSRVKRLKLTGPRSLLPDRHLALPMSPIRKPSALEFQEASGGTELSSMFAIRRIPRVSTQKLPHLTALNSFSPALPQQAVVASRTRESRHDRGLSSSLWTESVIPRRDPEEIGNLSMASSFMNESLGPRKRFSRGEECERERPGKQPVIEWLGKPPVRGRVVHRKQGQMSGMGYLDRRTNRRPLVAEKSFDHETPFNFGPHPLGMEQQSPGKELPKTNAALLDFHASENPVKHNKTFGKAKVQKATTEVGRKEIGKNFAVMPDWEDPGNHPTDAGAESFRITDHEWDSITPHHQHSSNTTVTSSAFEENPLSRKARPTSCSTVFNESVLGPIWRHDKDKKKQKRSSSPSKQPSQPQTATEPTAHQRDGNGGARGNGTMSAFEKMMSTFDAYKETVAVVRPRPQEQQGGDANGGRFDGGTLFEAGGGVWEGLGAPQNKGWQDFVSGSTEDPHTAYTAAHKLWQDFTSGVNGEQDSKDSCQRVPDGNGDYHENKEIESGSGNDNCDSRSKKLSKTPRPTSIFVLDELMCLEEIGSDFTPVGSQELSFTPVMPSRLVPDISTTKSTGAQRCMSENPLKICHTPANEPLRYRRELVDTQDQESGEMAKKASTSHSTEVKEEGPTGIHEQREEDAGSCGHTGNIVEANGRDGYDESSQEREFTNSYAHGNGETLVDDSTASKGDDQRPANDRNLESDVASASPLPTLSETERAIVASHQLEKKSQGKGEGLEKDPKREGAVRHASVGVQTESSPGSQALNRDNQLPCNSGNLEYDNVACGSAADTEQTTIPPPSTVSPHKQNDDGAISQGQGGESETTALLLNQMDNETLSQKQQVELQLNTVRELITQGQGEEIGLPAVPPSQQVDEAITQGQGHESTVPLENEVITHGQGEWTKLATVPPLEQTTSMRGVVNKGDNLSKGVMKFASVGVQTEPTTPAKPQPLPLTLDPRPPPTPTAGPISASVAVQCSLPLASSPSLLEKSTQTLTTTNKDTAVKTTEGGSKSCRTGGAEINSNIMGSSPGAEKHYQLPDVGSEIEVLRKELESMQNTVIWQALMLRLYSEH